MDQLAKLKDIVPTTSGSVSSTFISKETSFVRIGGQGVRTISSKTIFRPVQILSDKTIYVEMEGLYIFEWTGSVGGQGITSFNVSINDLVNAGKYFFLDNIQLTCSTDNAGLPVSIAVKREEMIRSDNISISTWNWDSATATKQNKYLIQMKVNAGFNNNNFGFGKLFPDFLS